MRVLSRVLAGLLLAVVVVAIGAFAWAWQSPLPPADPRRSPPTQSAVEKGAALAAIGNCATCHTSTPAAPYAGGRAVATPFGSIYASNITPDAETGIGLWSRDAFVRAVRQGVSRDGRHLYPAFPYDHMAKATDEDVGAVYAFLMTRRAIAFTPPANDLPFPYNMRMLVAGWKLLYMDGATYRPVAGKSQEWNRGAYLVEGLAHCGACHTPRNEMGGEVKADAYGGGKTGGWTAPALNAKAPAAVAWTQEQLFNYLRHGTDRTHGTAIGPMGEVVHNLAAVPESDVRAMAVYVADIIAAAKAPADAAVPVARSRSTAPAAAAGMGGAIYAGACAGCHGEAGRTPLDPALNLSLSSTLRIDDPANLVRIVREGISPPVAGQGGFMPPFASVLTDRQTAELVAYVRSAFTDKPPFTKLDETIAAARRGS